MGEQTMIADGQAETGEQPHREKQADPDAANRPIKLQAQGDQCTEEGEHFEENEMAPLQFMKVAASDDPVVAHFRSGRRCWRTIPTVALHSPARRRNSS